MLFCITGTYTPKALEAMGKHTSGRHAAMEKLVHAAGGDLIAMYMTMRNGPGAMAIIDVNQPTDAMAVVATIAASDGVCNVEYQRLFSQDEMLAVRARRIELQGSYVQPGAEMAQAAE